MRRVSLQSALALTLCSGASFSTWADTVPGSYSAPWAYYSTDMSPVEVNFANFKFDSIEGRYRTGHLDPVTKEFVEGPPIATVILPRAYINVFHPYSSKNKTRPDFQVEVLPDRVFGDDLTITMTYPDGLPYSVVYQNWPAHKPDMSLLGVGIGVANWGGKKDQIRALHIEANFLANPFSKARSSALFEPSKITDKPIGEYDGFKAYQSVGTIRKYFDNSADDIRYISCYGAQEKVPSVYYCTYSFALNSALIVNLKFLDFRVHGGREFARERIRAFKKVMCPIFQCDDKALQAAETRGKTP